MATKKANELIRAELAYQEAQDTETINDELQRSGVLVGEVVLRFVLLCLQPADLVVVHDLVRLAHFFGQHFPDRFVFFGADLVVLRVDLHVVARRLVYCDFCNYF